MTQDEAIEAGELVTALKDLAKEAKSYRKTSERLVGFDDELYVPRSMFDAMLKAGSAHAEVRLIALGVEVPK